MKNSYDGAYKERRPNESACRERRLFFMVGSRGVFAEIVLVLMKHSPRPRSNRS